MGATNNPIRLPKEVHRMSYAAFRAAYHELVMRQGYPANAKLVDVVDVLKAKAEALKISAN